MRNPPKFRGFAVVALIASAIVDGYVMLFRHPNPALAPAEFGIVIAATQIALASFGFAVYLHIAHVRRERLKRGVGVLARWMVSPAEWNAFAVTESTRPDYPRNAIKTKSGHAIDPIEIIAGESSVLIDGDFQSLSDMRGLQWLSGQPNCIECNMRTSGKTGTTSWSIRFPEASDAVSNARAACEHWWSKRKLQRIGA